MASLPAPYIQKQTPPAYALNSAMPPSQVEDWGGNANGSFVSNWMDPTSSLGYGNLDTNEGGTPSYKSTSSDAGWTNPTLQALAGTSSSAAPSSSPLFDWGSYNYGGGDMGGFTPSDTTTPEVPATPAPTTWNAGKPIDPSMS